MDSSERKGGKKGHRSEDDGVVELKESDEVGGRPIRDERVRELERKNKELTVRLRELEFQRVGSYQKAAAPVEGCEDISEESDGIISIVRDPHREIDTTMALKDAMAADLSDARGKINDLERTRTELQCRVELLEAKAALVDQLRQDIAFVEEELGTCTKSLQEASAELARANQDRSRLEEQLKSSDRAIKDLNSTKVDLHAQIINYKDKVSDMGELQRQLEEERRQRESLQRKVGDLEGNVITLQNAKESLEKDLAATTDALRNQKEEGTDLKGQVNEARDRSSMYQGQVERLQAENLGLKESLKRSTKEVETLAGKVEVLEKRLESSKQALYEIRSAAMRTVAGAAKKPEGAE